jgi:DNA-binding NtrC family response regulator
LSNPVSILLVDDNPDFSATLADIIGGLGWKTHACHSPEQAFAYLDHSHQHTSLMLLDIEFTTSQMDGLEVLAHTARKYPSLPVIMISGKGTIENAVRATKLGAVNFIEKSNISAGRLQDVLSSTLERMAMQSEHHELQRIIEQQGIIGKSKAILAVADKIIRFGKTDLNVLVTGETGTGKKLVAQALHAVSKRGKYPFVTVDIPNIPRELFQSELFGHIRGSFSGALDNKKGLFHQANRGTLFLDEIGDLPLELQANLLLPIETRIIRRVGSVEPENVDLRFVSATDRDLVGAMREGKFREQLYHRLRECEIVIPPLRERREDIPNIIDWYLQKHNAEQEDSKIFSPAAVEYLQNHEWKGNVRELLSLLRLVLQTVSAPSIELADIHTVIVPPQQPSAKSNSGAFEISTESSLRDDIARADQMKIVATLHRCNGNVSKAAAQLGISRETLHNKIRRYGINTNEFRAR